MGLLAQILEDDRERGSGDDKFLKSFLYYFELVVPPHVAEKAQQRYVYPLILPPQSLSMSEPFAVDRAFTNGGGLFVEEQGIVAREIHLSGHTGWQPKRQTKAVSDFAALITPKHRTFSRKVTTAKQGQLQLWALSGQRHFQFLQDTVFRTYADLKQDPATSEGTKLYFHNPRDDEHWRVIPTTFTMNRDSNSPLLYRYDIQLLAVPDDGGKESKFSEDTPVLNAVGNTFLMLRTSVNLIQAALNDVGLVQGELRAINGKFTSLFLGAQQLASSTLALLDGAATLVTQPFSLVESTVNNGEDALLETAVSGYIAAQNPIPDHVLNPIRKLMDAVNVIGSYPNVFQNSIQNSVEKFQRLMSLASKSKATLDAAAASSPPQALRDFQTLGTKLLPGDALRSQNSYATKVQPPAYTSAFEYAVSQGDTLPNLAARFLGDARDWQYLALFNDLRPPFISTDGLPGTVTVGSKILIPSFAAPPNPQTNPVALGARAEDPAEVHSLGRDLLLTPVGRDLYDLEIDTAGGSTDVRKVQGVDNLKQALRTRLITEQGTDILYRELGTARIVGLGVTLVDLEEARIRLANGILADPRVAAIRDLSFELSAPDTVDVDLTAEVRGFSRPEKIAVRAIGL